MKNIGSTYLNALHWLSKETEWLLLFDNADAALVNLAHFLPPYNHGNIIITSRNSETCLYASSHSLVSDFKEMNGVQLGLTDSKDDTEDSATTDDSHSSYEHSSHHQGPVVLKLWDIDDKCLSISIMLEDCQSWEV